MKTTRNIKTALDQSRKKKVPCRTVQIEDEIKKEIGQVHGGLLSDYEKDAIVKKEEKRIKKQALAIMKARIKILRTKQATMIVQAARRGECRKKSDTVRAAPEKKITRVKRDFHAIDVSY
jgi:hypothetical protein